MLRQFRSGKAAILVATDVAARGLDVDGIRHVINFDYPGNSEDYIHRIGRTGRSDTTGTSYTFFAPEKNARQASDLVSVLREAKQEIDPKLLDMANRNRGRGGNSFDKARRYGGFGRSNGGGGGFRSGGGNSFGNGNSWGGANRQRNGYGQSNGHSNGFSNGNTRKTFD